MKWCKSLLTAETARTAVDKTRSRNLADHRALALKFANVLDNRVGEHEVNFVGSERQVAAARLAK